MNIIDGIKFVVAVTGLTAAYYMGSHQDSLPSRFVAALWSITRHWTRYCKSLLSLSLPASEQSIFEEEFKYLIVTSSLFNETPQQEQELQQRLHKRKLFTNQEEISWTRIIAVVSLNVICFGVILMNYTKDSLGCLCLGTIAISYFLYRHSRHVQIRKIHASALDSMHEIISLSQESDAILTRLFKVLHVTKSTQQLQPLGTFLSAHFETYIETVQQLQPLIDRHNLSRLRDMYNINEEIPSTLLEFDSHNYTMDDIDLTYSVIGWKRREYLLYLLALDVMSNNRSAHYGKNWRQAIQANAGLVQEYNDFNKKLNSISITLNDCLPEKTESTDTKSTTASSTSSHSSFADTSEGWQSDGRTLTLMHRVSAVEKHIEDVQAKLFLCKQDTRLLSYGRVSTLSLEKMSKRFSHIDDTMNSLLSQWEESKHSLNVLLEDEQLKLKTSSVYLPSPPTSPRDFKQQQQYGEDPDNDTSLMTSLSRSRSYSGTRTSSFTKNRLHRIQSLKINRNNHKRSMTNDLTLSPINTTL